MSVDKNGGKWCSKKTPHNNIHKDIICVILMNMDYVEKFIRDNFTPIVSEDKNGMKVIFRSKNSTDDGIVWFERAKVGWIKKPIKQNHYIITNASMEGVLDHLHKYYNLDEGKYNEVRQQIIHMSISIIEDYFSEG